MERIKESRAVSFLVVAGVYLLAGGAGVLAYFLLPFDYWLNLLLADILATAVTFLFSVIFRNASVYDPYWSVQPIVILTAFCLGGAPTALGLLLLAAVWFWGVRLTANWVYTFRGLAHQDWRYTLLREQTGRWYPIVNFVGIHLVPTLIVYACTLPAVFAVRASVPLTPVSAVFVALSFGAAVLQGTADLQLHRFRRTPSGVFIRSGLWRHARHPNYLGEILMWWGVALAVVCASPDRWFLCAGAAANTLLFFCVSIPMADRRQSKKPGFAEYKAETRMLLPVRKPIV